MAGSGQREKFLQAVRDCQWQRVSQLVQQGSSLEQRDVAVSQAVIHSQWGLVSQLVQLGVSQQCRDLAVHKAARYCLWDTVDVLVAAGVSSVKRDFLLQLGLRQRQWALVSRLLSLGVGQEPRGLVVTAALEHGQWGLVLDALRLGVNQELRGVVVTTALEHGQWELVLDTIRLGVSQELRDRVLTKALENGQWELQLVLDALRLGVSQELRGVVVTTALEHGQWELVLDTIRLGVSQELRDRVLTKALENGQWGLVLDALRLGVSQELRGVVVTTALEHGQWELVLDTIRLGVSQELRDRVLTKALENGQWELQLVLDALRLGVSQELRGVVVTTALEHGQWELVLDTIRLGVSQELRDRVLTKALENGQWGLVLDALRLGVSQELRGVVVTTALEHGQWELVLDTIRLGVSQELRDRVLTKALENGLWELQLVLDALRLGVSQELRGVVVTTALEHGQWELVFDTIRFGVSQELRDRVLTKALENEHWDLVLDALRLGVKQELVTKVFQEVVSQKRWEHVPSLVKLCGNNDHTDFVLRKAIMACQWNCVRELVKTGLTPAQQGLVCKETLDWAHFDCAVELLRQGCEPDCAELIVLEAFRWSPCWNLVELLREGGSKTKVRDVILRTAKTHGCWTEYLMILKEAGATEKEMVDLVTTAFHTMNFVVMLQLLSLFASARRVFKQVLLRTRFPAHAINTLHTRLVNGHPDLAFYMLTAQDMWDSVVGMFKDARLSDKQRRFALKHAIRKRAWKTVRRMAKSGSLSHNDRRYAFLQAARRGKWRLSLKLSKHCTSLSVSDKVFALRFWLRRGLWNYTEVVQEKWVREYCVTSEDLDMRTEFFECVLVESVIAEKLEACTKVCYEADPEDTFSTIVFDTAIEHDKWSFIVEFCRHMKSPYDFEDAVKLAIEKKKWGLLKNLIEEAIDCVDEWKLEPDEYLTSNLFCLCVRNISKEEDSWQIVVPALNGFCDLFLAFEALYWDPDKDFRDTSTGCLVRNLAAWCLERSYGNACLVISVISGYTENVTRVIDQLKDSINRDVLMFCFVVALNLSDWESAVTCLQHLSFTEADTIFDEDFHDTELADLVETCRRRAQYKWVVYLGVSIEDWEQVRTALELCEDTYVVDIAIRKASSEGEWDIVESQLARCSQDNSLLCTIFSRAVEAGQSDICTDLISKINNLQARFSIQSLLLKAVTSSGDREEMVKLCIEFGFSTHIKTCTCTPAHGCSVCWDYPIKTALNNGQMPLVKLLYQAGACCNKQLFHCKENADLKNRLQVQGRQDIVEYLDQAATIPRTLQDLCRLQVSHLIGCHPGRVDRVMSLDISWPAKDLINFRTCCLEDFREVV
ncbi:uncharacterized protein [Littorina saxatilis]|uniref:Uncharacterized protein n=1 Tax=Littorina saxatilis TaxID=31220 RepID=A0AAN9GHP8_9CAEN